MRGRLAVGLNRFVNQLTLRSQRSDPWIGDRHAQGRGCIFLHLRCPLDHLYRTRLHGNRVSLGGQSSIFILAARPCASGQLDTHAGLQWLERLDVDGTSGLLFHRHEFVWGRAAVVFTGSIIACSRARAMD